MALSDELLARLRERAADPDLRSAANASGPRGLSGFLFGWLFWAGPKPRRGRLPRPCSQAEIERAEAALGFALPADLRQLYLEVADGTFGPGGGIYRLKELVAKWREMTKEPIGPHRQRWPTNLLPIEGKGWDLSILDRDSGKIIYWDMDELEGGGAGSWKRSFKPEADSMEAWLAKWAKRPPPKRRWGMRHASQIRVPPSRLVG